MTKGTCSFPECGREAQNRAVSLCGGHYTQQRRGKQLHTLRPRLAQEERFWAKVQKTESCWLWAASLHGGGYGQFFWDGRKQLAHRLAYELLVGPIPEDLTIDHLCRVRRCVNPSHMEPVTRAENVLRGVGIAAQRARQTSCTHEHPFTPENTYFTPKGTRVCIACRRLGDRKRQRRP